MKKIAKNFLEYYYNMSTFSIRVLAIGVELTIILYLCAALLLAINHILSSPIQAIILAEECASAGAGFMLSGTIVCFLSDIIIKHDGLEESDT